MQTFLPYADFSKSAKALDMRRLGKQRVEVLQILNVLMDPTKKGWQNHPAVLMWKGYELALCDYGKKICVEWITRGYNDTVLLKIHNIETSLRAKGLDYKDPFWLNSYKFHTSHRSNLLRKDKKYYRKIWPKLSNKLPYVWPVTINKTK